MVKIDDYTLTPEELYLRQTGKCYLEVLLEDEGKTFRLYCTDGNDYARTDLLENPTRECVKCLSKTLLLFASEIYEKDRNRNT